VVGANLEGLIQVKIDIDILFCVSKDRKKSKKGKEEEEETPEESDLESERLQLFNELVNWFQNDFLTNLQNILKLFTVRDPCKEDLFPEKKIYKVKTDSEIAYRYSISSARTTASDGIQEFERAKEGHHFCPSGIERPG
jgi:hypothetical protein